jgi:hypothetical protein
MDNFDPFYIFKWFFGKDKPPESLGEDCPIYNEGILPGLCGEWITAYKEQRNLAIVPEVELSYFYSVEYSLLHCMDVLDIEHYQYSDRESIIIDAQQIMYKYVDKLE